MSEAVEDKSPDQNKEWFVVHTYSGYENKVKTNLEKRVESMNMDDKIFRVIVPVEEEFQTTNSGKRKTVKKKIYPGYVLVEMVMNDDSWYVVRNTPGVTGFVGSGSKPVPIEEEEAHKLLREVGLEDKKPKIDFEPGESVRIVSGPFENFIGVIEEIFPDKGKVKVLVSMFGRETPIELEFSQVTKV